MGQVTVIFNVPPEDSDDEHETGLTDAAYGRLMDATGRLGWEMEDTIGGSA